MESIESTRRGPGRPPKAVEVEEDVDTMRPQLRSDDLRESDPQEAAKRRAEAIIAQMGDGLEESDIFFIPAELKDPSWDYNWKRFSVFNADDQPYISDLKRHGWDFVPAKRPGFDRFVPPGWKESFISLRGLVLMERPAEITKVIENRQLQNARDQVKRKEQQLGEAPAGTLPRQDSTGRAVSAHGIHGAKRTISGPIPQ